ncbi:MAG: RidA family protein [Candidatus Kapabacteria bacterium]|nr:RidA family protein [Candidatus Kapabacteria bacterium]
MKTILYTDNAPAPIGPYSQAVAVSGTLLFFSGQIALNLAGDIAGDDVASQTHQVCRNIEALLTAQNLTFSNVVKSTVFLKDMNDFAAMNSVYAEYFGESKPARSTIEVARLPKDVLVEIECIVAGE